MGKGDMRTRKGKIYRGSHGRTRPHKKAEPAVTKTPAKTGRRSTRKK